MSQRHTGRHKGTGCCTVTGRTSRTGRRHRVWVLGRRCRRKAASCSTDVADVAILRTRNRVTSGLIHNPGEEYRGGTVAGFASRQGDITGMVHRPGRKTTGHRGVGVANRTIIIADGNMSCPGRFDDQRRRTCHDAGPRGVTTATIRCRDLGVVHCPGFEPPRQGCARVTSRTIGTGIGDVTGSRFGDHCHRTRRRHACVVTVRAGCRNLAVIHRPGLETARHGCTCVASRTLDTAIHGKVSDGCSGNQGRPREAARGMARCTSRADLAVIHCPLGETAQSIAMAGVTLSTRVDCDVTGNLAGSRGAIVTTRTGSGANPGLDVVEARRCDSKAARNQGTGVTSRAILTADRHVTC